MNNVKLENTLKAIGRKVEVNIDNDSTITQSEFESILQRKACNLHTFYKQYKTGEIPASKYSRYLQELAEVAISAAVSLKE